jgi:dTDP-4-dehydrorhamnose 3,5-epimerase
MKIIETKFDNAFLIEPKLVEDNRGRFSRLFSVDDLKEHGIDFNIAQTNYSISRYKGIIRGMHYQAQPSAEIKLFKCLSGRVFDVIIDIRRGSPTFLEWQGVELDKFSNLMVYVPRGFAHGVQALEPETEILYFSSNPYSAENEGQIRWNDPRIGVHWPIDTPILSQKDSDAPLLDQDFRGIEV